MHDTYNPKKDIQERSLTKLFNSQLGNESQEKKDHRDRQNETHEGGPTQIQKWVSGRSAKGGEGDNQHVHLDSEWGVGVRGGEVM